MDIKRRSLSYDIIRIVALLMIVMVHVSAYIVIFFPATDKIEWAIGNLFNGLSRAGVPMFILLSGALLLNEDKPFDSRKFYKKNFLTMLLLTVGWMIAYGLFYAIILPFMEGNPIDMANFWSFILTFKGSEYPHLWYMLMVIGIYLAIPILRLFVKRENKGYIEGVIIAAIIVQFVAKTADILTRGQDITVSSCLEKFYLQPLTGFLGFLLIGWYLNEYKLKRSSRIFLYLLGTVSVVGSTLAVYWNIDAIPDIRSYLYSQSTLPALIYGVALFVFIQSLCKDKLTQSKLTATFSDCTFGIYLFHVAVLEIFVRLILPYERFGYGEPLPYITLLYLTTLLIPFIVVKLIGYIKGVRRIFFVGNR